MSTTPATYSTDLGKGFRVGEYTITGILGHGAMATVYLARDSTGHSVALKIFKESPGVSHTMLERFRREAEATKKLRRHPHILTVYETGQEGPYHYIAMEQVAGSRTLDTLLSGGPEARSPHRILTLAVKIANALAYAHDHQIVHRDVKPANIMLDEFGEPRLADFGVAELIDWPTCTVSGALTGTPMYMSPEQARAERVGPASDVYSLAVVVYEALTGHLPYALAPDARTGEVLDAVKSAPVVPPRKRRKNLGRELDFVLCKALQKNPRDRYPGMREFVRDLEGVLEGRPVRGHLFNPFLRVWQIIRAHRAMAAVLAVVFVIACVAGFIVSGELTRINVEQMLGLARTRNLELRMAAAGQTGRVQPNPGGAWQHIRVGRQQASAADWSSAALSFKAAADLSRFYKDGRTSALATIEQARAELMLVRPSAARELFQVVSTDPGTSPALAEMALFEGMCAKIIEQPSADLTADLQAYVRPLRGPHGVMARCLAGQIPPDHLLYDQIPKFPESFHNDALFAVALVETRNNHHARAAEALIRMRKVSVPRHEWPAPAASLPFFRAAGGARP